MVQELKKNQGKYAQYTDDFEKHVNEMEKHDGRLTSYATEAEIYATLAVYNVDIFV